MSYASINKMNLIVYCKYFVSKILCDPMQLKMNSDNPENSRKRVTTSHLLVSFLQRLVDTNLCPDAISG